MEKIALISFYNRWDDYPSKYSLSSMRLASSLLAEGHTNVRIIPFKLNDKNEIIAKQLEQEKYSLIGFPAYMWTSKKSQKINNLIESDVKRIVGGPDTYQLNPNNWIGDTYFVLGDGEHALSWMCNNLSSLQNQKYLPSEIFHKTRSKSYCVKKYRNLLKGVPLYSEEFMQVFTEEPGREFTWHDTEVGCLYNCGYCGHKTRPDVVLRDDDYIKEEIRNIGRLNFEEVFIIDTIIGGLLHRDIKVLQWYKQFAPNTGLRIYHRPEMMSDETISILRNSNVNELLIGLQSTNPKVPTWLRSNNLNKVKRYLPQLSKLKLKTRIELIVGLPGDHFDGLRGSLKFVIEEINPFSIWGYHLTVIPGTPVFNIKDKTNSSTWVKANASLKAISSNSYSEADMKNMLRYSLSVTSLFNYLKEENLVKNIKLIELERIILDSQVAQEEVFNSGNMTIAKSFWKIKLGK